MPVFIENSHSYFWLNSWILANVLQLYTQEFCNKHITYKIDPCHRLFDQMALSARSICANIAEGSSRHNTSIETEMRLTDVARGSADELMGDYFNFVLSNGSEVWSMNSVESETIWNIKLDKPTYSADLLRDVGIHIINQKRKFSQWTDNASGVCFANCMIILCLRLNRMLQKMLQSQLEAFKKQGGFAENMTQERLEARKNADTDAPKCPVCGKQMVKKVSKRGVRAGNAFWSCSGYPDCRGIINIP